MNKKLGASLLYALETPFGVWGGIELDKGHWVIGWALIAVVMALIIVGCKYFIEAQAEEIRK